MNSQQPIELNMPSYFTRSGNQWVIGRHRKRPYPLDEDVGDPAAGSAASSRHRLNIMSRIFHASLILAFFCVACTKARPIESSLSETLVKDGVLKEDAKIEVVASTKHLRENTFTVKVPTKSIIIDFADEQNGWKKVSSEKDELIETIRAFGPKNLTSDNVAIYFGFGRTHKSHMYIFVLSEEHSFIIRQNL